jgi:large subunit ribosomal protein L18
MQLNKELYNRRKERMRRKLKAVSGGRPRLSVYRSNMHIYAQIIDDKTGKTLAAASTNEKETATSAKNGANVDAAKVVGKLIAERGLSAGVKTAVFDRAGYIYHGRVKALADAARENGLQF